MKKRMTRVIEKHEGWYVAYVREIPGVNTQGRTRKSARRNLRETLALVFQVNRELAARRGSRINL
jgi:predicted RNase H-like HicB family nuclease